MNRLKNKVAVVYGDGNIGSAVSKAFAKEGAKVYLAGRTASKLAEIEKDIKLAGGFVKTTKVDALDESQVNKQLKEIIKECGQLDISFNAIGLPQKGIQGKALTELALENYVLPVSTYSQSHFITAKAALKQMAQQGNGVILMHTPNASRISPPFVGGMAPAWASIEALCRSISVEYGEKGIRSVCLLTTGIPETTLIDEVWEIHGKAHGISFEQFHTMMEGGTHRKKLTSLAELCSAAVFAVSDEGSGISGTLLNLSSGMIIH